MTAIIVLLGLLTVLFAFSSGGQDEPFTGIGTLVLSVMCLFATVYLAANYL